ncbi:MAG: hypothetical protein DMF49_09965 [Acidobacteria bacterium]|nr:MAG: hypothetical protein DMF49_09965 [Acidobacteriota bacterium]
MLRHLEGKSGWSLVFIDDSTAVYCPQERAAEPIRFATPGTFDLRRIGPAEAAAALKEGHRLSAWQQDGVLASLVTARSLIVSGRSREAREVLERCASHDPNSPALFSFLASVRGAAGDKEGAAEAMWRASRLAASASP